MDVILLHSAQYALTWAGKRVGRRITPIHGILAKCESFGVRQPRIELGSHEWQSCVLPLDHWRDFIYWYFPRCILPAKDFARALWLCQQCAAWMDNQPDLKVMPRNFYCVVVPDVNLVRVLTAIGIRTLGSAPCAAGGRNNRAACAGAASHLRRLPARPAVQGARLPCMQATY